MPVFPINEPNRTAGRWHMGESIDYQILSISNLLEIQYTKLLLFPDTFTRMEVRLDNGGSSGANVILGVYDDLGGLPNNKLTQGNIALTSDDDQSFVQVTLDSNVENTEYRHLWLAFICNSIVPQFISTDILVSGFHPVYFETTVSHELPQTANPDLTGAGSVMYNAILK